VKRRRRVNSGDFAGFPIGEMVPVSGIRLNADDTITIAVEDKDLPAALQHDMGPVTENRRRNAARKKKSKKSR
jgi:hypothetical protein